MSEDEVAKSNAGRWITGLVVALVLYFLSAVPVCLLLYKWENSGFPFAPKPALSESAGRFAFAFYSPALGVWNLPGLEPMRDKWVSWWMDVLQVQIAIH